MNLSLKIGNLELKNPVLAASGTFGYGTEYSELIDVSKLGAIITKTLTKEPRAGNPNPRIWEMPPYGMLNSIGLANIGVREFLDTKLEKVSRLGTKIIVNIAGKEIGDYLEIVEMMDKYEGFDAYELNVSCPNVKLGGMLFGADLMSVFEITRLCSRNTERPVITKLTPNVTDPVEIAQAVEEAGGAAITMGNTVLGMAVDVEKREPRVPFVTAGYSGPGIKPINLAKLYQIKPLVRIPVIGCGGIMNASDALEYIIAGASAVQVGSATYKHPNTAIEVIDGIADYMERHQVEDVKDLVGSLKLGG